MNTADGSMNNEYSRQFNQEWIQADSYVKNEKKLTRYVILSYFVISTQL